MLRRRKKKKCSQRKKNRVYGRERDEAKAGEEEAGLCRRAHRLDKAKRKLFAARLRC